MAAEYVELIDTPQKQDLPMASDSYVKRSIIDSEIIVLTIDVPNKGANILARPVLDELSGHLEWISQQSGLKGLIVESGKPGMFIYGADIREFLESADASVEEKQRLSNDGRRLFQRLCQLPLVSVAAIDGGCFGGGTELSMWCDRRIVSRSPATQLGLPEVKLGLIPGWGGTARSSRIVGIGNAVEWVTSGEPVDAQQAMAMGLVSDAVPADQLRAAAVAMIRAEQQSGDYLSDRQRWAGPIDISRTELAFLKATAEAMIRQKTKGNYPAPLAALEVMIKTAGADIETACQAEAAAFAELFGTAVNRALLNVFFLTDRNKKLTGLTREQAAGLTPKAIKQVGVIGAGIMGGGIAAASLRRKLAVTLTDAQPAALAKGVAGILAEVAYDKAVRGPNPQKMAQMAGQLNATTADSEFAGCDVVIEAVVENPGVKRELYQRLEPVLPADTILASNTSAISITSLADGLKHPERFVGIHFFNPVRQMPLVEVIRGEKTSDQTILSAVSYVKSIGKSPIVVLDGPGFLVNRLLLPYMNEALQLIGEGVSIDAVERAAKKFGMPMGPITLYDVVGIDTAYRAGEVMQQAFPDRVVQSPILKAMVDAGRLGQKSGSGFFAYGGGGKSPKGRPDPSLAAVLEPHVAAPQEMSTEQVIRRLFLPMVTEASRILEEKKVAAPADVDLGLILGIGFPPFQGGLLFWADTLGAAGIVEQLKAFESLGARYHPTPLLEQLARDGSGFYAAFS